MDPPTQLNNPSMELNVSKEESSNSSNASPLLPHGEAASALIMLVVAVIISLTIVGNVLVIVALRTSRALRVPQNLFLVSLASADILVAALVIPFSLANEVMGYWYFGSTWCACYLALDVLFCTSSIVHLCAISLDRYWSVTEAVSYNLNWRTPLRIKSMIGVVWLISAVISFPPLVMPKQGERVCLLIDETWYILSSSLFSFFIPGLIMILVYCKIYKLGGLGRQSESSFMPVEVEESPSSSQSSGINTAHQRRHLTDTQPQPSPAAGHLPMTAVAQMREKHFTFMLAVAMGVFVVFWFPFFFTYSLQALCTESCYIPKALFKVFFWIGYCNSSVNPIVYTIFNMDFRKAFMKNICRTCKRT